MLRVVWILSLVLIVGAHKHDSWKHDLKSLIETLTRELNHSLQKSLSILPEVLAESSYSESSSTNPCKSASCCHPGSSTTSTASPVATSIPGTLDDYSLREDSSASSSPQNQQQVGSMKGTPGEDFPNYTDIPATSFSCSDQNYVPGFYADLESRCQVFHACWPQQRESFLCPVGTTFNQALLACDYWYSSNCSLASHYYNVNGFSMNSADATKATPEGSMIDVLLGTGQEPSKEELRKIIASEPDTMAFISQFLPVKAKVTIYPETSDSKPKIVATASVGKRKKRHLSTTESQDFSQEPQSTTRAAVTEKDQYTTEAKVTEENLYSTRSPGCPDTSSIKYINVEEAVRLVLDRLDNVVKNVIREMKEYIAANDAKSVRTSRRHADKISMLARIKKLVPRPLVPPMDKEEEPVITSKTDAAVDQTATKPPTANLHKMPVHFRIKRSRLAISPLTKKVLIASYIKLLKLRKN